MASTDSLTNASKSRTAKLTSNIGHNKTLQRTPWLFGLPYGFTDTVDARINSINEYMGKTYIENIITQAPVVTIIPGKPLYLNNLKNTDKYSFTRNLIEASSDFSNVMQETFSKMKETDLRIYDFQANYADYIAAVNIMCRAGAIFLDLNDEVFINGQTYSFQRMDWRYYQFPASKGNLSGNGVTKIPTSVVKLSGIFKVLNTKIKAFLPQSNESYNKSKTQTTGQTIEAVSTILRRKDYVQFYVNPEGAVSEDLTNQDTDSTIGEMFKKSEGVVKDIAFMVNAGTGKSAAIDTFNSFVDKSTESFSQVTSSLLGNSMFGLGGLITRLCNLGGQIAKGNNIIMPKIYQDSQYNKSYSITIELRNPYGTKIGYYMNVFVPMCHALGLVLPAQMDANSYGSPFLVKAMMNGIFTCNLGMVSSFNISRDMQTFSVDGLANEVNIQMTITDLYSDLSYTTGNDPMIFANNPSLIEFLATNCGMSIIEPNINKKFELVVGTLKNLVGDLDNTVGGKVSDKIHDIINPLASFYR